MILRSGKILQNMSSENKTDVIRHTVTNFKSGIEPFSGRVHGELKQGLEVFIDSVENLLESKGVTDPVEQFREAKSHFNLSQGDLGDCCRSIHFRGCKTWEDLKGFLRSTYGTGDQVDVVLGLRKVLKLYNREGNSFVSQNAKNNDGVADFLSLLKTSSWADVNGKKAISLDQLGNLLQLAIGLHSLPDALVDSFDSVFKPTATEKEVMAQINKNIGKLAVGDSTILNGSPRNSKPVCIAAKPQGGNNKVNSGYVRPKSRVPVTVTPKKSLTCFNCGKEGHVKSNCMVQYCSYHRCTTHSWRECRALNHGGSRNGNRQYRSPSRSRNSKGWNGNYSRPSSPGRQNFHGAHHKDMNG